MGQGDDRPVDSVPGNGAPLRPGRQHQKRRRVGDGPRRDFPVAVELDERPGVEFVGLAVEFKDSRPSTR